MFSFSEWWERSGQNYRAICITYTSTSYHTGRVKITNEPRHDKTNKMSVRPALCAYWVAKDPRFLHADSEDSDQTGQMPRLI